jgi:hypothetical protein
MAVVGQCGTHNMAVVTQTAVKDYARIHQMGHLNSARIVQN